MRSVVFLLFIYALGSAQQADTLLQEILLVKNDTEKVNRLYKRGFALRNSDPQLAFTYAQLSEQNALAAGSKKHLAKSYNLLGILHYKKAGYTKAIAFHRKALQLRTECGDHAGVALSQVNLGNVYSDLKWHSKAEEAYLLALEAFRKTGDEVNIANCLINLGVVKQDLREHEAASNNYALALKIAERLNDYEIRSICLNNMAQVYFDRGNYERSVAFNQDALKLRQLMENRLEEADSYLNLAANFICLKQFVKAKEYLDTAYTISRHYDYFEAIQTANKLYADYYSATNDFVLAYAWLKKYNAGRDSILALREEPTLFNSDTSGFTEVNAESPDLHNKWLLVSVFIFVVLVPFILIRFRR